MAKNYNLSAFEACTFLVSDKLVVSILSDRAEVRPIVRKEERLFEDRGMAKVKALPTQRLEVKLTHTTRPAAANLVKVAPGLTEEPFVRRNAPNFATALLTLLESTHEVLDGDRDRAGRRLPESGTVGSGTAGTDALDHRAVTDLRLHLAPWQARRALSLIELNLGGTIKMGELATASRLSVSYFSKAFRADFGLSPHEYVIRRRVQRAQELMLVTQKTLACIAVACGFADQPHFTRLFRRIVGVTPARWRRSRCSELQRIVLSKPKASMLPAPAR